MAYRPTVYTCLTIAALGHLGEHKTLKVSAAAVTVSCSYVVVTFNSETNSLTYSINLF